MPTQIPVRSDWSIRNRQVALAGSQVVGDGNADGVTSGPDLIYAANATDLLAYHKSDGSLAWQAQMPDKLNYGASTMLVTAGG